MSTPKNIARHTVKGSAYNVMASVVTIALGFLRASLMTKLLGGTAEELTVFGVNKLAIFFLELAAQIGTIGLNSAYIHRKEVGEVDRTVYFTMNLGLSVISMAILAVFVPLIVRLYPDYPFLGAVIFAYMGIEIIRAFNITQTTILSKDLAFGRLVLVDMASSVMMTLVGPGLAWLGAGVWSLVGETFSGIFTRTLMILVFYRPWRPRLGWDTETVRWFWAYGVKAWWTSNLAFLIDRFDDFWIGTASSLGKLPLSFYDRAYEFARYPRRVVANPILDVFFPTFAHLQADRLRLSRAFFRATSLMVRAGCLFSLIFILTAPEFIRIFLTDALLPMQLTFQLMIVYTLLDPLSMAARNLMMATGYPDKILRARIVQTVIFIPAVIGLSAVWGIEGVAVAADLMVLVGAVLFYRYTRLVVDYSPRALWFWPLVAMTITGGAMLALAPVWAGWPVWGAFLLKLILIPLFFGLILLITERDQLLTGWNMIWGLVRPKGSSHA
ncbi:MAG: oligosaccharide flippase family protein [Anaerolineales bacterium]|nr:oligosaccharide flippase family protein [Anaerolineales bacterium]